MDCPGAFEIVLAAYDQVENGTSLEAVERTLAELIGVYPQHEVVEELRWKRTDLITERALSEPDAAGWARFGTSPRALRAAPFPRSEPVTAGF